MGQFSNPVATHPGTNEFEVPPRGFILPRTDFHKFKIFSLCVPNKIPVKATFKLFDRTILTILTYGSEVWSLYLNMDSTNCDKCKIEQTHTLNCKHILGINHSSRNHLTRNETGRYPINHT